MFASTPIHAVTIKDAGGKKTAGPHGFDPRMKKEILHNALSTKFKEISDTMNQLADQINQQSKEIDSLNAQANIIQDQYNSECGNTESAPNKNDKCTKLKLKINDVRDQLTKYQNSLSTDQSKLKFYESEHEQILSINHSLMQNVTKALQKITDNEKSK